MYENFVAPKWSHVWWNHLPLRCLKLNGMSLFGSLENWTFRQLNFQPFSSHIWMHRNTKLQLQLNMEGKTKWHSTWNKTAHLMHLAPSGWLAPASCSYPPEQQIHQRHCGKLTCGKHTLALRTAHMSHASPKASASQYSTGHCFQIQPSQIHMIVGCWYMENKTVLSLSHQVQPKQS